MSFKVSGYDGGKDVHLIFLFLFQVVVFQEHKEGFTFYLTSHKATVRSTKSNQMTEKNTKTLTAQLSCLLDLFKCFGSGGK